MTTAILSISLLTIVVAFTGAGEATAWWLGNDQPPEVAVGAPDTPQRGRLDLSIEVHPDGRAALSSLTLDGAVPPVGAVTSTMRAASAREGAIGEWWQVVQGRQGAAAAVTLDTTKLTDGRHTLRFEATDLSRNRNRGAVEVPFVTDNTPPQLLLTAADTRLRAGRPALLRLQANEPAALSAAWGDESLPLFPASGAAAGNAAATGGSAAPSLLAFVAVPVNAPAGEIVAHLSGRDVAGNTAETAATLAVEPLTLPRQALVVSPELASLATGPVATAESAQIAGITSVVRPEKLWREAFRSPVPPTAPRTTGFGDRRDYADGFVTFHSGYDVAVPLGAPITAAADGIVAFAAPLAQRGNAVIIDHGWGVFTLYAHLSHFDVQAGQPVAAGQSVGLVGSTGLSTGPHLHWEVRLRGLAVDPASWLALSAQLAS